MTKEFKPLAHVVGEWFIANAYAGNLTRRCGVAGRREANSDAALLATRADDAAGIVLKLDLVARHVWGERERYGRLVDELDACISEAAEAEVDFPHVDAALTTLAERLQRCGVSDWYPALVRSAALDARELARLPEAA